MKRRKSSIPVAGRILPLPCFFPSISSVKTNLSCLEYLRLLTTLRYPCFLISAYDIYDSPKKEQRKIRSELLQAMKSKTAVLMDSGNYEGFWHRDKSWSRKKFHQILASTAFSMSFCFDCQDPPPNKNKIISIIEKSVTNDQKKSKGTIVPIVHAGQKILTETVLEIAVRLQPLMIAIPERILGEGLLNRAQKLFEIRSALNSLSEYIPIHLLGTGNPRSVLVYTICGADSFDGLEWLQTTVNHDTGLLYHFQQRDLFENKPNLSSLDLPYIQKTLVHNLIFYKKFMEDLNLALHGNRVREFASSFLSKSFTERIFQIVN